MQAARRIILGRLIGKIIIILSFRVDTSKNKNIDLVKKNTRAIRLTHVIYETDHVSLLQDSTISSAQNFCFYVFYCNLKEKGQTTRNLSSKTKEIFM